MTRGLPNRELTHKEIKDLRVLVRFTEVYCRAHHHECSRGPLTDGLAARLAGRKSAYCDACRAFLQYAIERRLRCPLDPKPACKHCPVHCYKPQMRQRVREVMRFAGPYLIKRGRIDLLWHYFF